MYIFKRPTNIDLQQMLKNLRSVLLPANYFEIRKMWIGEWIKEWINNKASSVKC